MNFWKPALRKYLQKTGQVTEEFIGEARKELKQQKEELDKKR